MASLVNIKNAIKEKKEECDSLKTIIDLVRTFLIKNGDSIADQIRKGGGKVTITTDIDSAIRDRAIGADTMAFYSALQQLQKELEFNFMVYSSNDVVTLEFNI